MKEFELKIPGFTIACQAFGKPTLPILLCLHGWLDNGNSFLPLAKLLKEKYYLIAIDLPGHGHSSHLPEGLNYHFIDGIFYIIKIIKSLTKEPVHLLGHSMGACLATLVAGVAPSLLKSLVLIEALGPYSKPEDTCQHQLAHFLEFLIHENIRDPKAYSSVDEAAQARAKKGYLTFESAKLLAERGTYEVKNNFYWRHDKRLLMPSPLYLTEEQILSCLRKISVKTCLIWADDSRIMEECDLSTREQAISDIEVHNLPGNHHLHMENPGAVAKRLNQFYQLNKT